MHNGCFTDLIPGRGVVFADVVDCGVQEGGPVGVLRDVVVLPCRWEVTQSSHKPNTAVLFHSDPFKTRLSC